MVLKHLKDIFIGSFIDVWQQSIEISSLGLLFSFTDVVTESQRGIPLDYQ